MNFTKSLLMVAAAGLILVGCKNTSAENTSETTTPSENKVVDANGKQATQTAAVGKIETASFHIEGMSCAVMCASKIEKELAAMDGVQKAKVDFEKKTATVEYDNAKQSPEKLVQKVESVADGKTYKVSDVKSSGDHAMLFQDKEKKSKKGKKAKKDGASTTNTPTTDAKEGKPGCCSGKKHCSKPASV